MLLQIFRRGDYGVERHAPDATPKTDPCQGSEDNVRTVYAELCSSYHAIRDFRVKLLGFLPLVSATGIGVLLELELSPHLSWIGCLGFLVTVGLFVYERYNIHRCHHLILQGKQLEKCCLKVNGQFVNHPEGGERPYTSPHAVAAWLIYVSVMLGWIGLAIAGICSWLGSKQCLCSWFQT